MKNNPCYDCIHFDRMYGGCLKYKVFFKNHLDAALMKIGAEKEEKMDQIDEMIKKIEQVNEEQYQRIKKLEQDKVSLQGCISGLLESYKYLADHTHLLREELMNRNKTLNHVLKKASNLLIDFTGNCPLGQFDEHIDCDNCYDEYLKCWEKFLLKEDSKERNVK